ncbi:MAG: hypothetical protein J0M07_15245 [Anaerolineae bacterium]|uniref:hypothetical protein n=1 Tax=Candidatus Flexifilum breve TaxID=3140694 RepID=UPI001AC720F1|nr:hypothetical protein [Chloroflexota bacterium]MBK9750499.1 hypothetical protein [Chloroflexota bacterium]MBN8636683.1 hypothetical protein [Anaerolineae bacterium]
MSQFEKLVVQLDKEHSALRATVIVAFITSWAILFLVFSSVIADAGFNLLAVFLASAGAWGITAVLERYLQGRWTSGRVVEVDADGVRLKRKGTVEGEILSEDPAQVALWRFTVTKRARVPKGHSVFACAVYFEDTYVPVYTFFSPKQVEAFADAERFAKLASSKAAAGEREDLRLAGEQRRLREAENHRWSHGGEMSADDFLTYYARLKAQYPEWLDSKSS